MLALASNEPRGYAAAGPIRELSSEALNELALKLGLSLGDADDIRCLVPRLFELVIDGDAWLMGASWALEKLAVGDWLRWPAEEQEAVHALLMALVDRAAAGWFIDVVDVVGGWCRRARTHGPIWTGSSAGATLRRCGSSTGSQSEAGQVLRGRPVRLAPLREWLQAPERLDWAVQMQSELGYQVAELVYVLQVLA